MIIGIISDTHDHLQMINSAIELFKREMVEAVIHCGDFVAPFAIKLF
ncbi:metallophosphoesterase family protein, partial [Candidatus Sumerlaeota bacterium]|nr:metallophosphoesterase family protein [Candidatus Sumerlaeota bacterium]